MTFPITATVRLGPLNQGKAIRRPCSPRPRRRRTLELQIAPVADAQQLSDAALAGIELAADGVPPPLSCRSAEGGFSLLYEPAWRITREEHDTVVMRLVDRGESGCAVQCLGAAKAERH